MRRHAKASVTGSIRHKAMAALVALLAFGTALLAAAPAPAATVTDRPLLFTFNGSGTTAGAFSGPVNVDIDQAGGLVYVIDEGARVIDKFNLAGVAQNFSATGSSSLPKSARSIFAVNNSATNTGQIYQLTRAGSFSLDALSPAGSHLWEKSLNSIDARGIAVDPSGNIWVSDPDHSIIRKFTNTGSPPEEISSFSVPAFPTAEDIAADASGNLYIVQGFEGRVNKLVGGSSAGTIDPSGVVDVAVDQSSPSGHVFTLHNGTFNEYDSTGTLVATYAQGGLFTAAENPPSARGIAYDKALDRVYIGASKPKHEVRVYGPSTTATVPDATTEATTEKTYTTAKAHAKVNPLSLPDASYHFEWKAGAGGSGWSEAKSSPIVDLPVETNEIAVSQALTGLSPNVTYQVRVVTTNNENNLSFYSSPDTFTTLTPPSPVVTINDPSAVGSASAHISGTVNPQEVATSWWLERSTDPACTTGFTQVDSHSIPTETPGTVPVEADLVGLLPNQHYCVRIAASNAGGASKSAVKEFTTQAVPPQAIARGAGPRLDTSARMNAVIDPEGAGTTFHFEYSKDGGTSWIVLSDRSAGSGRSPIAVAEELEGLSPGTTYLMRIVAESVGGTTEDQISFDTRTAAEMSLPAARGNELVNSPDAGNQNVAAPETASGSPPITPDGEKAMWKAYGGAPGGYTGTLALFLSERGPTGWQSRSVVPPPLGQVGGGEFAYFLNTTSEDLSRFLFAVKRPTPLNQSYDSTLVRTDAYQHQESLGTFPTDLNLLDFDITEDASHAIAVSPEGELIDFASGTPEVLSIMPDGLEAECKLLKGKNFTGSHTTGTSDGVSRNWRPGYHLIDTADASTIYFQARPNGNCGAGAEQIYARNRETAETLLIDPNPTGREVFLLRATPDGKQVYFLTNSQLDSADTNQGTDIYRWDLESAESTCLSCVVADANIGGYAGANVVISDDFSHIYFISGNQLVPGEGVKGGRNLYLLSSGSVKFVTTLALGSVSPFSADYSSSEGVVSRNGNVLLFRSKAGPELTVDEVGPNCHYIRGAEERENGQTNECRELYRYEASTNSLECLSCVQHGLTTYPVGTPGTNDGHDFRLSTDGSTIAFATKEKLVPADVNRTTDIYEWRHGVFRLITNGVSAFQEYFAAPQVNAIDADGRNIFYSVVDPGLTGYEQDELMNLYDARIGGGFPRPAVTPHCSEEACQHPLQPAPVPAGASSTAFVGHGNLSKSSASRRCRKGKVRRRGRCVRRRHHRSHHRRSRAHNQGRAK